MKATLIQGTLVDVETRCHRGVEIGLTPEGRIASIKEIDQPAPGYILPGFVDAHIHIESSMLTPAAFARAAVVHGTIAAVADPHEIANVLGEEGVLRMLAWAEQTPFIFGFGAPSCVPATPLEQSGASLDEKAVARLLADARVTHLSEVMNVPGVIRHDPTVMAKIKAAKACKKPIDGHAPCVMGAELLRYASAGITTDHECVSIAEAQQKIACGMKIQIRSGSAAAVVRSLFALVAEYPRHCMFCSDDKHPDDLLRGHINTLVGDAVRYGVSHYDAIRAASFTPVEHYGLDLGLLHVGDWADFQIVENLRSFVPREVWLRGRCVARDGVADLPEGMPEIINRFEAQPVTEKALQVKASPTADMRVIGVVEGSLVTECRILPPVVRASAWVADPEQDILYLVLVNRYRAQPPVVAFVQGFELTSGAFATSVAHDSHHILAVGVTPKALAAAINQVIENRGGLAVADGTGHIAAQLPLPIAGLMSPGSAEEVAQAYAACDRAVKALGSTLAAPFMTLSFLALPVIPEIKVTTKGLFDTRSNAHVPLAIQAEKE